MDQLTSLSAAVKKVYLDIRLDERQEILANFSGLLRKPLLKFNEGYGGFISGITLKADLFDMWLSLQIRVITLLDIHHNHDEVFATFTKMFQDVLKTTEGGEVLDVTDVEDYQRYSFVIALAFRVYLDDLTFDLANPIVETAPTPPATGKPK